MDKPAPPPEAVLLRRIRIAAGIRASAAAAEVAKHSLRRFSASRWSQIENGYETRDGSYKLVRAPADTLARMAGVLHAYGLTPERLETEGQRPDAAEIFREMLRAGPLPEPPPPLSAVPVPLSRAAKLAALRKVAAILPAATARELEMLDTVVWRLAEDDEDSMLAVIWQAPSGRRPGELAPRQERVAMLVKWLATDPRDDPGGSEQGESGMA